MSIELSFNLKLREIPFTITNEDGGNVSYFMKELTGKQRDIYLTKVAKRMDYSKSTPIVNNFEGLYSGLLALCVYDENSQLVKEDVIQKYPAGMVSELFNKAQTMNGFDLSAELEAKNG